MGNEENKTQENNETVEKKDSVGNKETKETKENKETTEIKENKEASAVKVTAKDKAETAKSQAPEKPAQIKPEKPANCPVCNTSLKKSWYYRNMKYYCCKGCWKQESKKGKDKEEAKK